MRLARNRRWASYRFDGRTFGDPDCRPAAADGVAILQRRNGADLRVRCVDQR